MPELDKLPPPTQLFGNEKKSSLPPPNQLFNGDKIKENKNIIPQIKDFGSPIEEKTSEIIDNIPDLDEGKKQTIKDLTEKGIDSKTLSNSILTLQGKHAKQSGGSKYYFDSKGIPQPLANDERPPKGYNIASMWGTPADAENDSPLTTIGKHIFNILPSMVENLADVVHLPYVVGQQLSSDIGRKELATGLSELPEQYKAEEDKVHEADWYNGVKSAANRYKTLTSEKSQESFLNTQNIHEISDIAKSNNWKFTIDNLAGTVGQLAKSVGEFGLGTGVAKLGGLATASALEGKAVSQLGKLGTTGSVFAGSYMTQFGDVLDEAKKAGLSTEDAYKFASTISVPLALTDMGLGVEGKIFKDQIAASEKKNLIKNIVGGFVRDSEGKVTKETLDNAFNVTLAANTSLGKTWLKETGKTTLGEAGQESLQSFIQKAGEQIHDKLSNSEDAKFGTDALSAQSFAQYLQEGIMGALGGAPTAIAYDHIKTIARDKAQKENIFEVVKQGDEAVNAFKANVKKAHEEGDITPEQAADAIVKVDAYNSYNRLITNKDLNLNDNSKKELFNKTFQQEDLEGRMKSMGDVDKLSPIERGEYKGFEKQSHDLQKDINEIILSSQLKKEPVAGNKTIEDEIKKDNPVEKKEGETKKVIAPHLQKLLDLHTKTRTYAETPVGDYNKLSFNDRKKHEITTAHLETQPDNRVEGAVVTERSFPSKNKNTVYEAKMADDKIIRFSSSQKIEDNPQNKDQRGHLVHLQPKSLMKQDKNGTWEIDEEKLKGASIGLKSYTIENDGRKRKVIKIFSTANNEDYGKFIAWAKETHKGKNDYTYKEVNGEGGLIDIEKAIEKPLISNNEAIPNVSVPQNTNLQTSEDFTIEGQLQKQKVSKGIIEAEHHENVLKVAKFIQSVLPNINVIQDRTLNAAGKLSADGKTISINPYYAGLDTPIHEAGHVLIDSMGYNDPTIQKAIKQLQKSKLWKETAARYPELSEEMLGKEVLAEAIGREGAGIFEKESNINKFQKLLDKIFQWFKDKLGLERNEAKELAKKILRGEASHLTGEATGVEQLQKNTLADDLRTINEHLKTDLSAQERADFEEVKANILAEIADSDEMAQIEDVVNAESLEGYSLDDLIEVYNSAQELETYNPSLTKKLKLRIAYFLNETGRERLRKNKYFKEEEANKNDLKYLEVKFKVLSHMSHEFPELQELSPLFDKAYSDKVAESNKMKAELEKKAKAVIDEYNKKLGIAQKALGFVFNDNAKYFEYMDNKGKFRTDLSGLSKAQIDLLNHIKTLVENRAKQVDENGEEIQNEILKTDKNFAETFKTEGLIAATKDYFKLSEKPAYGIDYSGKLTNKFDKARDKDKGYSKDFYKGALSFIDDYVHTKYMSKFVPIVNSLDYLYSKGYGDVLKKPAAKKWLHEWSQMHIYQTDKTTDARLDFMLKFLRTITSQVVMGFNIPAAVMNIFMGNYNNWRAETTPMILKGNKRLFGKDGINKYGLNLIEKFDVVKADKDSNPVLGAGKIFQKLAFAAQTFGEYQIQGSMFLGQLTDKEWDSFEYNNEGELVFKKDANKESIDKKFNEYKNRISDIQGKYGEKDRRNFMRSEYGKTILQFRVWLPDAIKERFGKRYIDLNGNIKEGTWTSLTGEGLKELKQNIKEKGTFKAVSENKAVMANLKGAMLLGSLMVLSYMGDDDDKKRKKALSLNNAIGNLLMIFDTDQLNYMVKSPVASLGTLSKFIETFQDVKNMDAKKLKKDAPKIIPYSKVYTDLNKIFTDGK